MPGARRLWDYGSSTPRGAKFWLSIMNELEARGVADVLIAVVDGLSRGDRGGVSAGDGPDLHRASDPALAGICVVQGAPGRAFAAAPKTVYRAPTQAAAEEALDAFEAGPWGEKWRAPPRYWHQVRPELAIRVGERFGGCLVTGCRNFHRLTTGALTTERGPRTWKSLRAPLRRRIAAGASERD